MSLVNGYVKVQYWFHHSVDWNKGARALAGTAGPSSEVARGLADRPWKASTWSENQQMNLTKP
ncbi:hypothetical protein [Sporolactobacillus pectinivorans]|uniref:hypothetical protein n=1 Tax=Sporolactobacillus pectinivorans TaxID=1591408 RepID=UPI0012FE04F8|nr:hypothetical protein [Sporolactobacillus pectinivorans]